MLTPLSDLSGHDYSKLSSKNTILNLKNKGIMYWDLNFYNNLSVSWSNFTLVANYNKIIATQLVAINLQHNFNSIKINLN